MFKYSLNASDMEWAYEMYVGPLLADQTSAGIPFGSVYGTVPAGVDSKKHAHQDGEIFVVIGGRAVVVSDGHEITASVGDVVYIPPFTYHEIRNDSAANFDIVSLSWDDPRAAAVRLAERRDAEAPNHSLIVVPPPTPNGGLHLGHLAGPYLRADVMRRALESRGLHTDLLAGTDDQQSYVEAAAVRSGSDARSLADAESQRIVRTLDTWGVKPSRVVRPLADARIDEAVRRLFSELASGPNVTTARITRWYCSHCERELFQGLVRGECPVCSAGSSGDLCEACGRPLAADALVNATCVLCGNAAVVSEVERLVLHLDAHADATREAVNVGRASIDMANLVDSLTRETQVPYPLVRESGWGREVAPGLVIDPWLDLCLTYLAAVAEHDSASDVSLFLGFDNSFYYGVLLTAVALELGKRDDLPSRYITNRFLNLEGSKFSTSRGHAVWGDEERFSGDTDWYRAALLRVAPEGMEETIERNALDTDPLRNSATALIQELTLLSARYDGIVPSTGAWTTAHRATYESLISYVQVFERLSSPDGFSARRYVRQLDCLFDDVLSLFRSERYLDSTIGLTEERRTSVALRVLAAKQVAGHLLPVAPSFAQTLWSELGLQGAPRISDQLEFLAGGSTFGRAGGDR